jgi:hypothetical protein
MSTYLAQIAQLAEQNLGRVKFRPLKSGMTENPGRIRLQGASLTVCGGRPASHRVFAGWASRMQAQCRESTAAPA